MMAYNGRGGGSGRGRGSYPHHNSYGYAREQHQDQYRNQITHYQQKPHPQHMQQQGNYGYQNQNFRRAGQGGFFSGGRGGHYDPAPQSPRPNFQHMTSQGAGGGFVASRGGFRGNGAEGWSGFNTFNCQRGNYRDGDRFARDAYPPLRFPSHQNQNYDNQHPQREQQHYHRQQHEQQLYSHCDSNHHNTQDDPNTNENICTGDRAHVSTWVNPEEHAVSINDHAVGSHNFNCTSPASRISPKNLEKAPPHESLPKKIYYLGKRRDENDETLATNQNTETSVKESKTNFELKWRNSPENSSSYDRVGNLGSIQQQKSIQEHESQTFITFNKDETNGLAEGVSEIPNTTNSQPLMITNEIIQRLSLSPALYSYRQTLGSNGRIMYACMVEIASYKVPYSSFFDSKALARRAATAVWCEHYFHLFELDDDSKMYQSFRNFTKRVYNFKFNFSYEISVGSFTCLINVAEKIKLRGDPKSNVNEARECACENMMNWLETCNLGNAGPGALRALPIGEKIQKNCPQSNELGRSSSKMFTDSSDSRLAVIRRFAKLVKIQFEYDCDGITSPPIYTIRLGSSIFKSESEQKLWENVIESIAQLFLQ